MIARQILFDKAPESPLLHAIGSQESGVERRWLEKRDRAHLDRLTRRRVRARARVLRAPEMEKEARGLSWGTSVRFEAPHYNSTARVRMCAVLPRCPGTLGSSARSVGQLGPRRQCGRRSAALRPGTPRNRTVSARLLRCTAGEPCALLVVLPVWRGKQSLLVPVPVPVPVPVLVPVLVLVLVPVLVLLSAGGPTCVPSSFLSNTLKTRHSSLLMCG